MVILRLLQFQYLLLNLIHYAMNLIVLCLNYHIEQLYTDIILCKLNYCKTHLQYSYSKNSKIFSFASSRIKNIRVSQSWSKSVILIC